LIKSLIPTFRVAHLSLTHHTRLETIPSIYTGNIDRAGGGGWGSSGGGAHGH
jgi:hypothetical protein